MGIYTDYEFNFTIDPTVDEDVAKVIMEYDFDKCQLPEYSFFETSRFGLLLNNISVSEWNPCVWHIQADGDIKNYDNELEKFIEWLRPCIYGDSECIVGWMQSELEDDKTILFKGE